jgi:hypothetical protein
MNLLFPHPDRRSCVELLETGTYRGLQGFAVGRRVVTVFGFEVLEPFFSLRLHPNTSLRGSDCPIRQAFRPRPLPRAMAAIRALSILLRPSRGHVAVSISLTPGSGPSPSGTSDWPRVARASSSRPEQGPMQPSLLLHDPCRFPTPSSEPLLASPSGGLLSLRRPWSLLARRRAADHVRFVVFDHVPDDRRQTTHHRHPRNLRTSTLLDPLIPRLHRPVRPQYV